MTPITRRTFVTNIAAASTLSAIPFAQQTPPSFSTLKPLGNRIHPITPDEFHSRLLRAQELMSQSNPKFDALLIGPGTSLYYFSSINWWMSERLLALVIPASGQPILTVSYTHLTLPTILRV